eukprot:5825153-Pleurochrysis_carterae.AAC.1
MVCHSLSTFRGNPQPSRSEKPVLPSQLVPLHLRKCENKAPAASHLHPKSEAPEQRGIRQLLQVPSGNSQNLQKSATSGIVLHATADSKAYHRRAYGKL